MKVKKPPKEFGGTQSHPKTARPITTKSCMHITLRSSMARGAYSFLTREYVVKIRNTINRQAVLHNIRLYNFSICSNHVHLLVKLQYRDAYSKFIRAISGIIARIVLGAEKGKARVKELLCRFWSGRPYSKIVTWGRQYFNTYYYVAENDLEASGLIKYRKRNCKT
ncbi:MAG: transposase [Oligoflexia bacterium]|nr:transposase [Oligoflexia bacterium]